MPIIATGKTSGRMIIGSGKGVNRGTIAGGQTVEPPNPKSDVFGRRVMTQVTDPILRGGLIDKKQQENPASTAIYDHPFDGAGYRGVSTQPLKKPTTTVNNLPVANPLKTVDKTPTTARGTFFGRRVNLPIIKTQFGAAKSGPPANTAFHPVPQDKIAPTIGPPQIEIAKLQRTQKPPSFATTGNHWLDPHNSFIKGTVTAANPHIPGKGRWNTVKRSVV